MNFNKQVTIIFAGKPYPDRIGGAEIFAFRLCKGLRQRGYSVTLAGSLSQAGGSVYRAIGVLPIGVGGFGATLEYMPLNLARALRLLAVAFSLIVSELRHHSRNFLCFGTHAALIAYPLSRLTRRRLLVRCMGGDLQSLSREPRSFGDKIEKLVYKASFAYTTRANAIIVMSEWMREFFVKRGLGMKVVKIPNGVEWKETAAEKEKKTRRSPTLVYVGRFVRALDSEKRVDLLLEAFARLREFGADANLMLVGSGPLKDSIMGWVAQKGLQKHVRVIQARGPDDVREILKKCDVFVLPSMFEGLSNALLEAILAGLPVVASDIPANREVLRNIPGSVLVDVSVEGLSKGLVSMLHDLTNRTRLAQKEVVNLAAVYSLDSVVSRYEEILH